MLINLDSITMINLKVWATQRALHQDGRIIQIVLYNCDDDHDIIYWLITSYRVLYIKNLSYINSCILGINVSFILLFIYFTLYWKTIICIHTIILVYIHLYIIHLSSAMPALNGSQLWLGFLSLSAQT